MFHKTTKNIINTVIGVVTMVSLSFTAIAALLDETNVYAAPLLNLSVIITSDGQLPITATDGPGLDSSLNNSIARTLDIVTYSFNYSVNEEDGEQITIRATLPADPITGEPLLTWVGLPAACISAIDGANPDSEIIDDGRTIICNIGDEDVSTSTAFSGEAKVAGGLAHDIDLSGVVATIEEVDVPAQDASEIDDTLRSSSLPKFDWDNERIDYRGTRIDPVTGENGVVYSFMYTINILDGGKGSEDLASPFTFDQDIYTNGVLIDPATSGIKLLDWDPAGDDGCKVNYEDGNWNINTLPRGINFPTDPERSVDDSGDITCITNPDGTLSITITGADTSGNGAPTLRANGTAWPANLTTVIVGSTFLFIPIQEIIDNGGELPISLRTNNFDPDSTSGASNQDEPLSNNNQDITVIAGEGGWWTRYQECSREWNCGDIFEPMSNYDAGNGYVMPNQVYSAQALLVNRGLFPIENPEWCIKFDNQVQTLIPSTQWQFDGQPAQLISEAGLHFRNENVKPDFGYDVDGDGITQGEGYTFYYSSDPITVDQGQADCDDTSFTWLTWDEYINGGGLVEDINKVKVKFEDPNDPSAIVSLPGRGNNLSEGGALILNLQARDTFLTSGAQIPGEYILEETGSFRYDSPNSEGNLSQVNFSGYREPYDGTWRLQRVNSELPGGNPVNLPYDEVNHTGVAFGDRLRLTRAIVRVDKELLIPTQESVFAGRATGFVIRPTLTALNIPEDQIQDAEVIVTDTLPAELEYIEGSASIAPTSVTINPDGTTTIVWNLGIRTPNENIDPITFRARTDKFAPNGTQTLNSVEVSSPLDTSPVVERVDTQGITIVNTAAFNVFKRTTTPLIDPDGTIRYILYYANTGQSRIEQMDFIDVLPYDGDGLGSSYLGTLTLDSVTPNAGEIIRYTSAAPATINTNARDASNNYESASSSTIWCTEGEIITGTNSVGQTCPASIADSTALRITQNNTVERTFPITIYTVFVDAALTNGNSNGDLYFNQFSGVGEGLNFPVVSNIVRTTVAAAPYFDVPKNVEPDGFVLPGAELTYNLSVTNIGNDRACNTVFTDLIPTDTTFKDDGGLVYTITPNAANTAPGTSLYDSTDANGILFTLGSNDGSCPVVPAGQPGEGSAGLAFYPGDTIDITFTVIVDAPYTGDGTVDNQATITNFTDTLGNEFDSTVIPNTFVSYAETQNDDILWDQDNDPANGGETGNSPTDATDDNPVRNGVVNTGSLSGFVFFDENDEYLQTHCLDGDFDAAGDPLDNCINEDGTLNDSQNIFAGVEVCLTEGPLVNGFELPQCTLTDANGQYFFPIVPTGEYTIELSLNQDALPDDALPATNFATFLELVEVERDLENSNNNFAVLGTSLLGDTVWLDLNENGVLDPGEGEIGLANVVVNAIWAGIDAIFNNADDQTYTTTTDANGLYIFRNLFSGIYNVSVDESTLPNASLENVFDPDGDKDSDSQNAGVPVAGENLQQDFGYNGTGSIGDTIFLDFNNNGTEEATEPGIAGVTVTLEIDLDGDGVVDTTLTTTTDADGNYSFNNLPEGIYTVTVDQTTIPAGLNLTTDVSSTDTDPSLGTSTVSLADGQNLQDVDFGLTGTSSIGDTIWIDWNNDGIPDPTEPGVEGVEVLIEVDLDGDGVTDVSTTVTTDANGNYSLTDLPPGNYTVTVDPNNNSLPDGFELSTDVASGDTNTDLGVSEFTLGGNQDKLDVDFAITGTASFGDTVWFDSDNDGIQDSIANGDTNDELGLEGVLVTANIDTDLDGVVDYTLTTTTDANGNYSFNNLPAGSYTVTIDPSTLPNTDLSNNFDKDGNPNNSTQFSLATGQNLNDVDFGYNGNSSIGDTIYYQLDLNGDGVLDEGPGIEGVTVTLEVDLDGDGVVDTTLITTTDANGNYSFNNLPAGDYTVIVDQTTLPGGVDITSNDEPTDTTVDNTTTISLPSDTTNNDVDFGVQGSGSIGDTLWIDWNNDGILDAGEDLLEGILVQLELDLDGDGVVDVTFTTTTDVNGNYSFDNLPPGNYTVTVDPNNNTLPDGFVNGYDQDGGEDKTTSLTLGAGEVREDIDFAITGTASFGDEVYYTDQNGNNIPLEGVTVTAGVDIDGDGVVDYTRTTTTDANGNYTFDNLPSGSYTATIDTTTLPNSSLIPFEDLDGTLDNQTTFSLSQNENKDNVDFVYTSNGSISDRVYYTTTYDLDGDGDVDGDDQLISPGVEGVTLTLEVDIDGDGVVDGIFTTTTDANGNYIFDNLPAGDYTVIVDQTTIPGGDVVISDDFNPNNNDPLDTTDLNELEDTVEDGITVINLQNDGTTEDPSVENEDEADFGVEPNSSIEGVLWYDQNGDGIIDSEESNNIEGVTVQLEADVNGDGVVDFVLTTTTSDGTATDSEGNLIPAGGYIFENLPPGDYTVTVDPDGDTLPTGLRNTDDAYPGSPNNPADDNTNSLVNQTVLTITAGNNEENVDFGYNADGTIDGIVWLDTNEDSEQNSEENGNLDPDNDVEPGLGGIEVVAEVDIDGDGVTDYTFTTTTSDGTATDSEGNIIPEGSYVFENLPPGDYTVTVDPNGTTLPEGVTNVDDTYPGNDTNPEDVDTDGITLITLTYDEETGETSDETDLDFGYNGNSTIGDTIFLDLNGNGVEDEGEPGIEGVEVIITGTIPVDTDNDGVPDSTTTIVIITTTDENGNYEVEGLPAGEYTIEVNPETLPEGSSVTNDLYNGGVDPITGEEIDPDDVEDGVTTITLPPDTVIDNVDFAVEGNNNIEGTIWYDQDEDGDEEIDTNVNETPLEGIEVIITVEAPVDTDNDGIVDYIITIVIITTTDENGNYSVENLPAGEVTITVNEDTLPAEYGNTTPDTITLTLPANTEDTTYSDNNFGYVINTDFTSTIWQDTDGDGIQDPTESGIPGVTVTITNNETGETFTTTTDENGEYSFENLKDGEYTITVDISTLPPGFEQTYGPDGVNTVALLSITSVRDENGDIIGYSYDEKDFGFRPSPEDLEETGTSLLVPTLTGVGILGLLSAIILFTKRRKAKVK